MSFGFYEYVALIMMLLALFIVPHAVRVLRAAHSVDTLRTVDAAWSLVEQEFWNFIELVEQNSNYADVLIDEAADLGVDARMLYVIRKIEMVINTRPELTALRGVRFVQLLARAESIYQRMRRDAVIVSDSSPVHENTFGTFADALRGEDDDIDSNPFAAFGVFDKLR